MTWILITKDSADSIALSAADKSVCLSLHFLFPMGTGEQNLFLGNRLLLTLLRMIDPENTNVQVEGSSLLESQLSTEFCKFLYLTADKLWFVKLEYYILYL